MQNQIVAVYGSLKKGFGNHRFLENSTFLAEGVVNGWDMYSLGAFPMIVVGAGQVKVEVYEVDSQTFKRLDALEGYPNFYNRNVVEVQTHFCPVQAWIYFGHIYQVSGERLVVGGNWTKEERMFKFCA